MIARDPVELAQRLVRRPSVAPLDAGAMGDMEAALTTLGFACSRWIGDPASDSPADLLYARIGSGGPHLCFGGHIDVAPVGDEDAWTAPPFRADIIDDTLYGRGAADMKGAIAAFLAAVARRLLSGGIGEGSLSVLITGGGWCENGPGAELTHARLEAMDVRFDHAIIGSAAGAQTAADTIVAGRCGVLFADLTVDAAHHLTGTESESASTALARLLNALLSEPLDGGIDKFPPSALGIVAINADAAGWSLQPASANARLTAFYNPRWSAQTLTTFLERRLRAAAEGLVSDWRFETRPLSDPFVCEDAEWLDFAAEAVAAATGAAPERRYGGAPASAALFAGLCPIAEIGLPGGLSHRVDERVSAADIRKLTDVYDEILSRYFRR